MEKMTLNKQKMVWGTCPAYNKEIRKRFGEDVGVSSKPLINFQVGDDIVFKLEKAFDITIPRDDLFPDDVLTSAEFVQDGRVTEAGLAKLKERMPFADLTKFEENPLVQDFGNLLTVQDLCNYVSTKVAAPGEEGQDQDSWGKNAINGNGCLLCWEACEKSIMGWPCSMGQLVVFQWLDTCVGF